MRNRIIAAAIGSALALIGVEAQATVFALRDWGVNVDAGAPYPMGILSNGSWVPFAALDARGNWAFPAGQTGAPSFSVICTGGAAPTTPNNGDVWCVSNTLYMQSNGSAIPIVAWSVTSAAITTALGYTPASAAGQAFAGDVGIHASGYVYWGATDGSSGYGIRDNSGTLQVKNSGGAWTNLIGAGGLSGPGSSVVNNIAVWNATTGLVLGDSGVAISSLAPLASPTFTGTPAAPTPAAGDNSTKIATTAFVYGGRHLLAGPTTVTSATSVSNTTALGSTAYSEFEIDLENCIPAANSQDVYFQVHSGGSYQSGASSYDYSGLWTWSGSYNAYGGVSTQFSMTRNTGSLYNSGHGLFAKILVSNPSGTTYTKPFSWVGTFQDSLNSQHMTTVRGGGFWNGSAAAIDGWQVTLSGGGNWTTCTYKIYGWN
jgi:hypothetical protein